MGKDNDNRLDFDELAETIGLGVNGEGFKDFVVANKVFSTDADFAAFDMCRKNLKNPIEYYSFTEDDIDELFRKYDNNQLTRLQMSRHLLLLYLLTDVNDLGVTPFDEAKLNFIQEIDLNEYVDETQSRYEIEEVRKIFKAAYNQRAA